MFRIIVITIVMLAQSAFLSGQADSLWAIWNNSNQPDSLRLKAMHQIAKKITLFKAPDSAFILANKQLLLARNVNNALYIGEALNTQGVSWAIRGDLDKALELFEESYKAYEDGKLSSKMSSAIYNIGNVYSKSGDKEKGLEYMQRSLKISLENDNPTGASRCYHGIGRYFESNGEYEIALSNYEKSLNLLRSLKDDRGEVTTLISIAVVHKLRGDYIQAVEYLGTALTKAEAIEDETNVSYCLNNLGNLYMRQEEPEKALSNYTKALQLSEKSQDKEGIMKSLMNLGNCLDEIGRRQEAVKRFKESLVLAEEIGNKQSAAIILNNLGSALANEGSVQEGLEASLRGLSIKKEIAYEKGLGSSHYGIGRIYTILGQYRKALFHSKEALKLAQANGNQSVIRDAAENLADIHAQLGNYSEGLAMHKLFILTKDSLARQENQRALLRHEYEYEYAKQVLTDSLEFAKKEAVKDLEIKNQEAVLAKQRIGLGATGGGLLLLMALAFAIYSGKKKSDELLLNILPAEVAEELKEKGQSDARLIQQVTVLFTDFKGFTALSEQLSPKELVHDLHECFSAFDKICEKYGIEKIKTIGDAYMAAGGLPSPKITHAEDVTMAALEMAEVVELRKASKIKEGLPFFEIRVGINTGAVVAGIVGVKKFAYDIWGDTVNIASRMESSGDVGKVNISQATYEFLKEKPDFSFKYRGKIEAKGKGEMAMYFVEHDRRNDGHKY